MSRFIKPTFQTDNVYIEFRFENSLRKYQSRPNKKVKGEHICNNCCAHQNPKKIVTNSPVGRCYLHFSKGKVNQVQDKTVQNKSFGGMSQIHMVSSNKSIKLSKRKALQELNSHNNHLQMKIYASLVNMERQETKNEKDEDQVFLNDFQPSLDMDGEQDGEGDADFGKIQIDDNFGCKMEDNLQKDMNLDIVEDSCQSNEIHEVEFKEENLNPVNEQTLQTINKNEQILQEDSISLRLQNMKVEEEIEQINSQNQKQESLQIPNEDRNHINIPQQVKLGASQKLELNVKQQIAPKLQVFKEKHSWSEKQQENLFIRNRPEEDSIISSKLIDENQMSQSMMQKCLAFQGGRIYIDSSGQNFYISVRVFNKLRKNCSRLEDLISTLISQRPYLQDKRQKLRDEFEQYLKNQA